eukprot:TRINITY_DN73111_c0_g1_i1.p1 TRINITY_DN73111_c0_g1~~TRINITY_DN73111_c0_g1_i1.p1  ORF type:complete len:497 (+),score=210.28 TRINITY_DN73111_c0_g1_i1:61-1491(+)
MTHRLSRILEHLQESHHGADQEVSNLRVIYNIKAALHLSVHKLNQIVVHFIGDMVNGLNSENSDFKMLPSFVYRGATQVTGKYLGLDLGGTNFRVIACTVRDGRVVEEEHKKFKIPQQLMSQEQTATELFDFIANCVRDFVETAPTLQGTAHEDLPLGFTFSFPVDQKSIDSGTLVTWTKGFSTSRTEGKDVVELLRSAFTRAGLKIRVNALVNDTVGTLAAGYFGDNAASVGVILGTGSNACYWESVPQIRKLPSPAGWKGGAEKMCINIEWGNFDSTKREVLPLTEFDDEIDKHSPNKGAQRFEKMISGMYLGEIARLLMLKLVRHGVLPTIPSIVAPLSLDSSDLSGVIGDTTESFQITRDIMKRLYKYDISTQQAETLQMLFASVAERSARLSAAGIAAILLKTGEISGTKICVDGAVFEKVPYYQDVLRKTLDDILQSHGHVDHGVTVELTSGGSGVGAAFIAALAEQNHQ